MNKQNWWQKYVKCQLHRTCIIRLHSHQAGERYFFGWLKMSTKLFLLYRINYSNQWFIFLFFSFSMRIIDSLQAIRKCPQMDEWINFNKLFIELSENFLVMAFQRVSIQWFEFRAWHISYRFQLISQHSVNFFCSAANLWSNVNCIFGWHLVYVPWLIELVLASCYTNSVILQFMFQPEQKFWQKSWSLRSKYSCIWVKLINM